MDEDSTADQENKLAKTQATKRQAQSILSDQEDEKLPKTQAEKRTADPTYQLKSEASEDYLKIPKVEDNVDNLQELDDSMKEPVATSSTEEEENHDTKEGDWVTIKLVKIVKTQLAKITTETLVQKGDTTIFSFSPGEGDV